MAKQTYKIPESINRSYLDHELVLATKSFQMQPLPMKVVLFWAASIMGLLWVCMSSPLKSAGVALIPFGIWWLVASAIMGKNSRTREMAFQSVLPALNYVQKANRLITTRSNSDPSKFFSVAPYRSIDKSGLIEFADGTVGQAFLVVGTSSRLVFEQDKIDILDRVDKFWRKVGTDVEYSFITTKESQRVYRQLAALGRLAEKEQTGDPELRALMEERKDILIDFVGKKFTSIHQYLVLKADNLESLQKSYSVLLDEIENSSLMIRQCTKLEYDDAIELLSGLYQPAMPL